MHLNTNTMKLNKFYIIVLLSVCFVATSCSTSKKAMKSPTPATTTMECTQITNDDNYIVEVQSMGKNVEKATEAALVYAVKGMLFEGIPGSTVNRIQSLQPLVKDASLRTTKKEYFDNLFESGDYRMYVETIPSVTPKVVKVDGGYNVKVSVILKKQLLRKRLEKDGIIKSLGSSL